MFRPPLTVTQQKVLDILDEWHNSYGNSPNLPEIAAEMFMSKMSVWAVVVTLQKYGYVRVITPAKRKLIVRPEWLNAGNIEKTATINLMVKLRNGVLCDAVLEQV